MLAAQLTLGEASDFLGCGVAFAQCLEHSPAGHAEGIAGDTGQLDVGSLGVASHRRTGSASSRPPVERFGQTGPRRHIFIHYGPPQALFDSYA